MKTCGFENQINQYLDGELSGAKLRSFEAHLQACPLCREEVEQYRGMLDGLRGMEEREVPSHLQDKLHAALSAEISKGDGRVKRKFNPWALTAAAAVVVCLIGGAILVGSGGLLGNRAALPNGYTGNADILQRDTAGGTASNYDMAEQPKGESAPSFAPAATAAALAPSEAMEDKSFGGNDGKLRSSSGNSEDGVNALTKADEGRKIIYTANLVVETRSYDSCMETVKTVLSKYGGYRESSQEYGVPDANESTAGRTAVISIRMPIGKYDTAMDELQAMGNVLSKNESTEDVSRQYVDTQARNKTLTMQRDQLYILLAKADSMENIIALQNEISRLTVEIEQMTAQLNFWDDKVSYSTITVEIRELVAPKTVKPVDPDLNTRMNGALNVTLNNMKKGLEDFTVNFVGFLPWLAIILVVAGVLAAVIIPVAHRARKAEAARVPERKKEE